MPVGSKKSPLLLQYPNLPPAKLPNCLCQMQCGLCDHGPALSSERGWTPSFLKEKGEICPSSFTAPESRGMEVRACQDSGWLLGPDQDVSRARPPHNVAESVPSPHASPLPGGGTRGSPQHERDLWPRVLLLAPSASVPHFSPSSLSSTQPQGETGLIPQRDYR